MAENDFRGLRSSEIIHGKTYRVLVRESGGVLSMVVSIIGHLPPPSPAPIAGKLTEPRLHLQPVAAFNFNHLRLPLSSTNPASY